jgi:Transposase IS116/IS110/IS902 family
VVSDITGVSAVAMLQALLAGQTDREALAELAKGRLRSKKELLQKALEGVLRPHHRLIIAQLLADIEFFEEQIGEVGAEIARRLEDHQQDLERLDDIPGVNQRIGEIILAEVGTDMSRFPSEHHLASWAGLCPGNNQSAGKRRSSRIRPGNQALKNAARPPTDLHDSLPPPRWSKPPTLPAAPAGPTSRRNTSGWPPNAERSGRKSLWLGASSSASTTCSSGPSPGATSEPTTSTSATRSKWSTASPNASNPSDTMSI